MEDSRSWVPLSLFLPFFCFLISNNLNRGSLSGESRHNPSAALRQRRPGLQSDDSKSCWHERQRYMEEKRKAPDKERTGARY
jgi:hypothetical protein